MRCPHCHQENSEFRPFGRPVEGGRAYAQECAGCCRIIGMRPRLDTDPVPIPPDLTAAQIDRLLFVRWRLRQDNRVQTGPMALHESLSHPGAGRRKTTAESSPRGDRRS